MSLLNKNDKIITTSSNQVIADYFINKISIILNNSAEIKYIDNNFLY